MHPGKIFLPVLALLLYIITSTAQVKRIRLPQLQKQISNTDTVYVVNFWATSCAPCVAELPHFEKLQTTYKSKPLKVLLVRMDFYSKYPAVKAFVANRKLSCEVLLATRKKRSGTDRRYQ